MYFMSIMPYAHYIYMQQYIVMALSITLFLLY